MPPLKGILADRNDSNQSCLCIFNGTISKDKILSNSTLQSFTIKYSQLNIRRKDWNFMGKLINLF
ncbi:hypothetical protein JP0040_11850 [Helicobacter pylori]|nr:hypothetical protein HPK25_01334 [Helicobacter pylori]GHP37095.1 hypothetical protein JP0040_11850 [Helicobacter pylori]GHQ41306.1 hypothetical protein JP0067_10920 [Helicobacter pylori]GHQ69195.1 hypothetical protein JP0075_11760 [Helicobacter pylori]GHS09572.1 hypothetical protein JP0115_09680 [Helicobacter pylori]